MLDLSFVILNYEEARSVRIGTQRLFPLAVSAYVALVNTEKLHNKLKMQFLRLESLISESLEGSVEVFKVKTLTQRRQVLTSELNLDNAKNT